MRVNESPIAAQQVALLSEVLLEAMRTAAARARVSELTPELAAVAVVKAFQEAQRQFDAAAPAPLASVVVDVLPDGTLDVRGYVAGSCDSSGRVAPADAGAYITKALQEVRSAVLSPKPAP